MTEGGDWPCEAYGPEGVELGARCFFSPELGQRACASPEQCSALMATERVRVHGVIQQRAAEGDPDFRYLAECFERPEQLLGGGETPPGEGGAE